LKKIRLNPGETEFYIMLSEPVKFAQKCHSYPDSSHIIGAQVIPDRVLDDSKYSLSVGELGRVHYAPVYSTTETFRPRRKVIDAPRNTNDDIPRGKKYIPHSCSQYDEKSKSIRMFPESSRRQSDQCDLPVIGWTRKRMVVQDNGLLAQTKRSDELQFEKFINRKKRVNNIIDLRNNIPVAIAGDKPYKKVELSAKFYEQGGLIPGTSIQSRVRTIDAMQKSDFPQTVGKKLIPYKEKLKAHGKEYELKDVLSLTV
jgi:hypothetical protein